MGENTLTTPSNFGDKFFRLFVAAFPVAKIQKRK
jgi:hypothetical protein